MFTTYILVNISKTKTYIGHSDGVDKRLTQHNAGRSRFTKTFGPWFLYYKEEFLNLSDSIKRERYFKSAAGRRWLKRNVFNTL